MHQPTYEMRPTVGHPPQHRPGSYRELVVTPAAGALGAYVSGVDLKRLSDTAFAEIESALADHLVLVFPDQVLRPVDQERFGTRFGPVMHYPFARSVPGRPNVSEIRFEPGDRFNFGSAWHSDSMDFERPPMLTTLHCVEAPSVGGETSFANQYLAWETLSRGMQRLLADMKAICSHEQAYGGYTASEEVTAGSTTAVIYSASDAIEYEHPVARTHPVTGKKALYVNSVFSARFAGMTSAESLPLLQFLWSHAVRPEFVFTLHWRAGMFALWDNRCVQHYAHNNFPGCRRIMHRLVVEGDKPV